VHEADRARTTGSALGGSPGPAYVSGEEATPECAWEESAGALCSFHTNPLGAGMNETPPSRPTSNDEPWWLDAIPLAAGLDLSPGAEPASEAEPWWSTVEEFDKRLSAHVRVADWTAAESLAREYLDRAESAREAVWYAGARATALRALGRHRESLEADALAERLEPTEPFFKIKVARRLIAEYGRPEEGLAKLAEAEPLLQGTAARDGWLSEKGLGLLALGRDAEAVECFRVLARPDRLTSMSAWNYIGLVDFRLVCRLIAKRLVPELCVRYLEAAEVIAAGHNRDQLGAVQTLLARASDASANERSP